MHYSLKDTKTGEFRTNKEGKPFRYSTEGLATIASRVLRRQAVEQGLPAPRYAIVEVP